MCSITASIVRSDTPSGVMAAIAVRLGTSTPSGRSSTRCMRRTPFTWSGMTSEITVPCAPARAVRPERWV